MPARKELPLNPLPSSGTKDSDLAYHARPLYPPDDGGEYRLLMECAPFQEPEPSREERDELWGLVVETIDTVLTPKEREVWTAYVVERASYREIAERMGLRKSRAHQIQKVALVKLRLALESHPTIMEYYTHG